MSVEWFCRVMGSEVGPLGQDQLVDMVRNHQVNAEDLVRRGSSPWVAAFEVKGLFEAAAKPPKAKPPREPVLEKAVSAEPAHPATSIVTTTREKTVDEEQVNASSTNSMKNDWFCIAAGEKRGPMSFDDLHGLATAGTLRGRDRVWRGSAPKWKKADEVDGLIG